MKIQRIKLVWGASRVIKGHWYLGLFGFYDRMEGKHDDGLAISGRGLLLWLLGVALVAYVMAATALFWIWQRNPYSLLTYDDALLYPFRSTEVLEKKGQAFIAQGADLFRAGKYHDAANLLRLGLARQPRDFRARQMLAQYHLMANQRATALRVLQEGLTDEYPGRPYLEVFFNAVEQGEDYATVVKMCERYEPRLRTDGPARDQPWLLARQFAALGAAGRWAEALALAMLEGTGESASEHRVLALLGLGRATDAVAFLAEWGARPGANRAAVTRLRVRALREAGRFDEMETAIRELRALSPSDPAPAVYGVVQHAMAGREAETEAAFKDYLFRFGGAAANLMLLAQPLAEIGDLPRVRQCIAAAAERGYAMPRFNMLLVETLVHSGDWAAAGRLLASIPPPTGRDAAQTQLWRDWMQHLIEAVAAPAEAVGAPAEPAQLALLEFLRGRPWPIAMFRRSIEALSRAGRLETEREAIAMAARGFPASAWVQAQGVRVSTEIAAREAAAAKTTVAASRLPEEKVFFQRLDEAVRGRRWAEAARLMREVRDTKPAPLWLEAREANLRFAQVRIAQAEGDFSGMVASARLYLNGEESRVPPLVEVGREFFNAGDKSAAVALAREVLRRSPNDRLAQRLLADCLPPPPAAKK